MTVGEFKTMLEHKGYTDDSELMFYTLDRQEDEYDLEIDNTVWEAENPDDPVMVELFIPDKFYENQLKADSMQSIREAISTALRWHGVDI